MQIIGNNVKAKVADSQQFGKRWTDWCT